MKTLPTLFLLAASAASMAGEPAPAAGQRELLQPPKSTIASPITDRFAVRAVYLRPSIDTLVRYDSSTGVPGTLVSGEDTLGFPGTRDQGTLDMMFRIGERHRLRADFYKLARRGDEVIAQNVRYGDDVFVVNDRVLSSMDLRKLGLSYSYSLLRREKVELGLGLALHLLQLEGTLDAPARFVRESLDVAGPFATLTADATWRVTRRFSLNAWAHYLGGNVDDVKGGYQAYHGDVQFRARPNLAFGLGYTHTRYKIDSRNPDFLGYFKLQYAGPEAFVRVSF